MRRGALALLPSLLVLAPAAPASALVVYHGPRDQPAVALTFDDGPGRYMDRILDILAAKGARATFFVIGDHVGPQPGVIRSAVAEGDEVANHTWSHPRLTDLAPPAMADELSRASDAIEAATGRRPTLARAPYGAWNDEVTATMNGLGMANVWCDVVTKDWSHPAPDAIRQLADEARNGSILCLHDNVEETIEALPLIIDDLRAKGLGFVTVSEFPQLLPDDSVRPVPPATPEEGPAIVFPFSGGARAPDEGPPLVRVSVDRVQRRADLLRRGLLAQVRTDGPGRIVARAYAGRVLAGRRTASILGRGTAHLALRLTAAGRRLLRHDRRSATWRIRVVVTNPGGGSRTVIRPVDVRR